MERVLVSGASGFIASHIIRRLLADGYRVRGTVRKSPEEAAHLRAFDGSDRLELVTADLLAPHAFDEHVVGCDYVLHTASPYVMDAKDPQKDLVEPAVRGTRSMMEACAKSPSVKRVVLTSSMAAITDEPDGDHVLTEEDWNTKSTLDRNPYYLSKTLAEREGWRFVEETKRSFDLVTINPFIVIGPSFSKNVNTSNQLFVDLMKGVYPGIMNLTWGFVDVSDVADAHVRAMREPKAKGRYLCAAETLTMRALVEQMIALGFTNGKLPKLGMDCAVGDYAARLGSYLQPKGIGSYLRTHVGRTVRFDHSKIERDLGVRFRPIQESVKDTLADLVRWKHIEAPR